MSDPLTFLVSADPEAGPARLEFPGAPSETADTGWLAVDENGTVRGRAPRPGRGESLRVAVALMPEGRTLALAALRPSRARGHDRDAVQAVVREAGQTQLVEDPRFSVTFDGQGAPRRLGLELWLSAGEDEDAHQYARRATGEVDPEPQTRAGDGVRALSHHVSWRSAGEAGSGWFLVVEPA